MNYNQPNFYPPIQQRSSLRNRVKDFFLSKSMLNRLILINIAVYIAFLLTQLMLSVGSFLMAAEQNEIWIDHVLKFLAVPASWDNFIYKPWTLITSLFFHAQFWHLLFNMVMLYVSGAIFRQYLSEIKLIAVYLIGGICGNLLYMTAYNYFPAFADVTPTAFALGASGSIMAILATITVYKPNHTLNIIFLGPIALKWIMLVFLVIDLLNIPKGNAGGHIAHLGGALFGGGYGTFLVAFQSKNGGKKSEKRGKKQKFTTSYQYYTEPVNKMSDEEYNAIKTQQQKKIDLILDKISKSGYEALNKEEKEFLFYYSRK